jgi:hypothetical protein
MKMAHAKSMKVTVVREPKTEGPYGRLTNIWGIILK